VPPPDAEARAEILALHCKNKPTENLDYTRIAARMKRFSGADIAATSDMAAEIALRETLKTGKIRPLTEKDFAAALNKSNPPLMNGWPQRATIRFTPTRPAPTTPFPIT
jgi:SpoVK/Ycf46/Vps4 family AAA+-type ATPase